MKKLSTLLVTVMLLVAMTSTVVSAEELTAKITITNEITKTGIDLNGKTFTVYKVFDATIDNDFDDVSHISYTLDADFEDLFTELGCTDDSAAEAYIHNAYDTSSMQTLVAAMESYIQEDEGISSETTISGTVSASSGVQSLNSEELSPGYYLVLDTSTNGSTISAGMLVSLPAKSSDNTFSDDAVIALKGSQPEIDKEIWHNDSNSTGGWDSVGDYEIGDTVTFRITADIPSDLTGYTDYTYSITDTMSEGISFDEGSIKIYTDANLTKEVEGQLHTETYYTDSDEKIFTLDFQMLDIKAKFPVLEEFYIVYTGTVTDDAATALNYETNTVELKYSNNPYDSTSYGKDEDTVYSYTFEMEVLKTDSTKTNPLADAVFSLWVNPDDETLPEYQVFLKQDTEDSTIYYVQQSGTVVESEGTGCVTTDETGEFIIKGLDDELTYILKEVEAPDGYTKAEDLTFRITATYSDTLIPTVLTSTSDILVTGGTLSTIIVNTSSELFPGTGGMGTTIFLVLGGTIMLAAVILLGVRRKKEY